MNYLRQTREVMKIKTTKELEDAAKEVFILLATKDLAISEGSHVLELTQKMLYTDVKIKTAKEAAL